MENKQMVRCPFKWCPAEDANIGCPHQSDHNHRIDCYCKSSKMCPACVPVPFANPEPISVWAYHPEGAMGGGKSSSPAKPEGIKLFAALDRQCIPLSDSGELAIVRLCEAEANRQLGLALNKQAQEILKDIGKMSRAALKAKYLKEKE